MLSPEHVRNVHVHRIIACMYAQCASQPGTRQHCKVHCLSFTALTSCNACLGPSCASEGPGWGWGMAAPLAVQGSMRQQTDAGCWGAAQSEKNISRIVRKAMHPSTRPPPGPSRPVLGRPQQRPPDPNAPDRDIDILYG